MHVDTHWNVCIQTLFLRTGALCRDVKMHVYTHLTRVYTRDLHARRHTQTLFVYTLFSAYTCLVIARIQTA